MDWDGRAAAAGKAAEGGRCDGLPLPPAASQPACQPACPCPSSNPTTEEGRIVTDAYCLLPADLRDLGQLEAALEAAGLDREAPTLVLSECVLVYLQPGQRQVQIGVVCVWCVVCVCVGGGGGGAGGGRR